MLTFDFFHLYDVPEGYLISNIEQKYSPRIKIWIELAISPRRKDEDGWRSWVSQENIDLTYHPLPLNWIPA